MIHSPEMDQHQFLRLMELAGPDTAAELLRRLTADLDTVANGLRQGFQGPSPDWDAVRAHTHVLIALAGVAGAVRLQHLAEAMNLQAHHRDDAGLDAKGADLMQHLSVLVGFIAAKSARAGAS
jgi:hypothetical protein